MLNQESCLGPQTTWKLLFFTFKTMLPSTFAQIICQNKLINKTKQPPYLVHKQSILMRKEGI